MEDNNERDKIRDAELELLKEKLSIVITSFEAEKVKISADFALKSYESRTKLAEREYALASIQTAFDESQRKRINFEEKVDELQEDLTLARRENDILKGNNKDLQEVVSDFKNQTKNLRKTIQSMYATMELATNNRDTVDKCEDDNSNLKMKDYTEEISQKNKAIKKLNQLLQEKENEKNVIQAELAELNKRLKVKDFHGNVLPEIDQGVAKNITLERSKEKIFENVISELGKANDKSSRKRRRLLNHSIIDDDAEHQH